jgi:predicted signal transduction protein with EAL and GGDEF domain
LSKETLSSLETSPEAKSLWDEIQDEIKCERAWAIAEKHLSLARQLADKHCSELEQGLDELRVVVDLRGQQLAEAGDEVARLKATLAQGMVAVRVDDLEAKLRAIVAAGDTLRGSVATEWGDDAETIAAWDAATKEAR